MPPIRPASKPPSFDQFHDYAERGRAFAALAGFDAGLIGGIAGLGIA
jgi:UDP-N-acetylmuramoylalanine--D-glutamate ligase